MEYKKAAPQLAKSIKTSHQKIVEDLELQTRVFRTTEREPFITIKDHKPNFQQNPKTRLINPTKCEIGKISKQITANINSVVREKTRLKQWKNSDSVIDWFKMIEQKSKKKFIQFDVVNFYPSISAELLAAAIQWARNFVDISNEEEQILMEAKKTLFFRKGTPWCKKGNSEFDVAQGSFDGAETCELVGLYLLVQLSALNIDVGLYRDDGLAVSSSTPRQVEMIKKKICAIFRKHGLEVTIDANLKSVDFLDITMDLEADTFKPFTKPNTIPLYIDCQSNHPPCVLKNIPAAVNKRLSKISCNEAVFNAATPAYQEALDNSGYKHVLKFDPEARKPTQKSKNRKEEFRGSIPPST